MRWKGSSHVPGRRRVHFPRIVKNKLLKAQRDKCAYCGQTHHSRYLRIDHKYPFSRGGSDEIDNLQLLCNPCNMRKGILSDEEFRHRYQRLLPDGSIPSSPIPQALFTEETQRTNNPQNVRAIYNARFTAARERHGPTRAPRGPICVSHGPTRARANLRLARANLRLARANLRLARANTRPTRANLRLARANARATRANTRPTRANLRLARANPRLARANARATRKRSAVTVFWQ